MTTAVISPSGLQSLPGLGWNGRNTGTGGFSAMTSEETSRMFVPPRKTVTRSNSSSSLASTSSTNSTSTIQQSDIGSTPQTNGETATSAAKKKTRGGFWPVTKTESTSGITNARANGAVQPSNHNASNGLTKSALPTSQSATNGVRNTNGPPGGMEQAAILALLPMNGTFERKQINVPFYPDILKIGRQTNAKTVPTQTNGFFDSKVLSRQHAEIWAERGTGKIWIRDVRSSNGTFVNGQRLSPESRESEPHELRQHDALELGIDIVSEDQKTIVHHKVSAKVEYAGLPANSSSVLDLNFGDLDPSHGGPLLVSHMSTPMVQSRSRPGGPPGARSSAPPSVAGSQLSSIAQQRQANFWGTPLNIEQLVKHLTTEMRAAKQQAQDLDHANTFLNSMIVGDGNSAKVQPPPAELSQPRQQSARVRQSRVDHAARFGDPPAPPPQQPLPEKPDSARASPINTTSGDKMLKRADTAKAPNGTHHSPTGPQSSQILSLVQALDIAKKELDSQSARMKQLEDMLTEERSLREAAEEQVRRFEEIASARPVAAVEPVIPDANSESEGQASTVSTSDAIAESESVLLQQRLDQVVAEMQKMKSDMEQATRRAESAEQDASSARLSLAEMIEKLRKESEAAAAMATRNEAQPTSSSVLSKEHDRPSEDDTTVARSRRREGQANGHIRKASILPVQLEQAMATVLRTHGSGEITAQSAPYISMVGVVLIGVGMMAYLNSLQRGEK